MLALLISNTCTLFLLPPPVVAPPELGGLYWSSSLIMNQVASFVGAYLYLRDTSPFGRRVSGEVVWCVLASVEVLTIVSFLAFFWVMNDKHDKSSFFSTKTAKQLVCWNFINSEKDQEKIAVFDHHPSYYRTIKPEASNWLRERWPVWKLDKPEFLTVKQISDIPDEIMSKEEKEEMINCE